MLRKTSGEMMAMFDGEKYADMVERTNGNDVLVMKCRWQAISWKNSNATSSHGQHPKTIVLATWPSLLL
jgi:hypothetical protein